MTPPRNYAAREGTPVLRRTRLARLPMFLSSLTSVRQSPPSWVSKLFRAQPIVLNERQAGAAIEGVVRDERLETAQLAVDTHGYTDVAMAIAKLLGFDLCPRLKALKDRHLFLSRGSNIPEILGSICHANIDLAKIAAQWEHIVHLIASVHSGHTSAIHVLARFGSAARGDPLYEALVHLGRLLRTVFLADYFVNEAFRREAAARAQPRRVRQRLEALYLRRTRGQLRPSSTMKCRPSPTP